MSAWVVAAAVLIFAIAHAVIIHRVLRVRGPRARRRQALEINDNIVQGLTRVKWALEGHRLKEAQAAADETLAEAQRMVTELLTSDSPDGALRADRPGREEPERLATAGTD